MTLSRKSPSDCRRAGRGAGEGGIIFAIVVIALILAIGLFYLVDDRPSDRQAEAVGRATQALDEAARSAGDAARKAADDLRPSRKDQQ